MKLNVNVPLVLLPRRRDVISLEPSMTFVMNLKNKVPPKKDFAEPTLLLKMNFWSSEINLRRKKNLLVTWRR
jgi:hypothetical protein